MMGNGFGLGMGWMWLFGLLTLIGIALLIAVAVRALGGGIRRDRGATNAQRSVARRILDERYARGELSTEEYRERLRTLHETE
jgi:putative membrane protein